MKQKILIAGVALIAGLLIGLRGIHRASKPVLFVPPPATAKSGPCVDFRQAASQVGENGCVTGYVLRAFNSKGGNTFLDFCQDYRHCPFTSVIFSSDHAKFGDLEVLQGRKVALRGFISAYNNQAEIVVHDPWQIQVTQ